MDCLDLKRRFFMSKMFMSHVTQMNKNKERILGAHTRSRNRFGLFVGLSMGSQDSFCLCTISYLTTKESVKPMTTIPNRVKIAEFCQVAVFLASRRFFIQHPATLFSNTPWLDAGWIFYSQKISENSEQ